MKISSLYNVITDASDVLDYFEGVDSQEQLISRLERLKHADTRDLMACIDGLRGSISEILDESLEVSTLLGEIEGEDESSVDDELSDAELDSLTSEETPPAPAAAPGPATAGEPAIPAAPGPAATGEPAAPATEKQNPAATIPPEDKKPNPS